MINSKISLQGLYFDTKFFWNIISDGQVNKTQNVTKICLIYISIQVKLPIIFNNYVTLYLRLLKVYLDPNLMLVAKTNLIANV